MMTYEITTPWKALEPVAVPMTDEQRHDLFSAHVNQVAEIKMPWLLPLLAASNAAVYAAPGVFLFAVPKISETWHSIPEMAHLIGSVPWVEPDTKPQ